MNQHLITAISVVLSLAAVLVVLFLTAALSG